MHEVKSIRIVFIVSDLSRIGGIQNRTKIIMRRPPKSSCEYITISRRYDREFSMERCFSLEEDGEAVKQMLKDWDPCNTVLVIGNSIQIEYPPHIRNMFYEFPIISLSSGQMAFMIQDTDILTHAEFLKTNLASCILSFSDGDIAFQRQLGVHGQIKIAPPVDIREVNDYNVSVNTELGYVGRIDFHAKDCERLLDIAQKMKKLGLPPIKIFTTDGGNSPDYTNFIELATNRSILSQFDIILNCDDKKKIYSDMRMLILPSKKEAFGNVILEAFSFGVPVLAASYAPGPVEMFGADRCGLLLDDLSGNNVVKELLSLREHDLMEMSSNAFNRHRGFSIESHIGALENIAREVIEKFDGDNKIAILPILRPIDILLRRRLPG